MSRQNDACILLFVKDPTGGQVKSRLCAALDRRTVASLYRNFVLDILCTLHKLDMPLKICFHPDSAKVKLEGWLGKRYSYVPQCGHDLGERMKNALRQAFDNNFSKAVVIGSDSPDLPLDFLKQAFRALNMSDTVIGPSSDGGYYLVGFAKTMFLAEAFENISWSTDTVCEQTLNILRRHGRKLHLLPLWHDVDTVADLESLLLRNRHTAFRQWRSFSYLLTQDLRNKSNV